MSAPWFVREVALSKARAARLRNLLDIREVVKILMTDGLDDLYLQDLLEDSVKIEQTMEELS